MAAVLGIRSCRIRAILSMKGVIMKYGQQQERLCVLDEMLAKIEKRHGIGCTCATCASVANELNFVRDDLKRRDKVRMAIHKVA